MARINSIDVIASAVTFIALVCQRYGGVAYANERDCPEQAFCPPGNMYVRCVGQTETVDSGLNIQPAVNIRSQFQA